MITLFLSFILSLVDPTPIARDVAAPPAPGPPTATSGEACTVEPPVRSLLEARPEMILDSETIRELEFGEDGPTQGAGDGWDPVRIMLRDYAPGISPGPEMAERQS